MRSTLAFSHAVHWLNVLAVMRISDRLLRKGFELGTATRSLLIASTGLIHMATMTQFDRPEETALLWLWLDIVLVHRGGHQPRTSAYLGSGLMLGLAALTAPWVAVLGAGIVLLRAVFSYCQQLRRFEARSLGVISARVCEAAVVSSAVFSAWYVTMMSFYPDALQSQFWGSLEHLRQEHEGETLAMRLTRFGQSAAFNASQLSSMLIVLFFYPTTVLARGWRNVHPVGPALFITSVVGVFAIALLRPSAYTYLAATQLALLPCFAIAFTRFLHPSGAWLARSAGWCLLGICVMLACKDTARLAVLTFTLPDNERPDAVFARLQQQIPSEDLVACTSRHWYAFQGRNPWRHAYFASRLSPDEVLRCRWLVLYPGVGLPPFLDAYTHIEQIESEVDSEKSYAYSLWRRRE